MKDQNQCSTTQDSKCKPESEKNKQGSCGTSKPHDHKHDENCGCGDKKR